MTSVVDKNEIEMRIAALKAAAFTDGAESTDGLWILLQENAKAKSAFAGAISLRELLGISEDAMVHHCGKYWRKQFTKHTCGFIHRQWKGCTFISVKTTDEDECNVPTETNIINRGDIEVEAIQNLIEKIVSSSKEDGASRDTEAAAADVDAMDMEDDATVDDLDGKLLQNIFNCFRLDDMRRTVAGVSRKWRETALDASPSPEDYLATLGEEYIPSAIEILGQQQEQETGLSLIFGLVRQNTSLQNAIGDVRVQQRVADAQQQVAGAPTIDNCLHLLNCALDNLEADRKEVPVAMQHLARRVILMTQQRQNEQMDAEDEEEQQPRRKRQQQQIIPLKYHDNAKKTKTMHLQVKTITRSCKPTASTKIKQQHIRRITNEIEDAMTERLGVNGSDELRMKVFQQLANNNGLTLLDSSETVFTFDECFTVLHKANLSINQLCIVASFIRHMRPVFKGMLWPNQLKQGLCDIIGKGNLEFFVKQLPLIVAKNEDKWAHRPFWSMTRPAELAQRLLERAILDGSFEDSIEFSLLLNCIVVVWGIDKADRDTAASLRIGNRLGGNSSKHTQLVAATEDAAECYTNIMQTFMSSRYPLKAYLQELTYDNYHMLVLTIGEGIKACRCITIQPTPSLEPCTIRQIRINLVTDPVSSDSVDWDEPHDNLPHTVFYCEGDELRICLIQTTEEISGIQIKNSNNEHTTMNIQFMIPILLESLNDADLREMKIVCQQIIGFPSNDYKLNLALTGINSASAKNPCVCCLAESSNFKQLSEALYRHRDPSCDPPHKDAPKREGTNSTKACHDRIMAETGGGALPLPEYRKREITAKNGSCFHEPAIDMPWIKIAHGEALHIMNGIINHLNSAIFLRLRVIDSNSSWFQKAKSILAAVTTQLEEELSLTKTGPSSTQYRKDYLHCQKLLRDARDFRLRAEQLREKWEERSNEVDRAPDNVGLAAVESAEAKAVEALNAALKHAQDDTGLAHQIKLSRGNTELKKLLEKYIKGGSKKPFGPGEYCFKAGLSVCGANFLTQHGGNDLTTDNGMDVMDRFDEVATYAEQAYPEDSEEAKEIRDFFELCRQLAKELADLLSFMKSQKKCNATDFLNKLDKFLKKWDAALPDKDYFLKLHHLIHHVVEFIRRYGMYGRVSAEGFEAIHALITKLKTMSRSQSTLNRIKTVNGKTQTVMKPEVMSATVKYTERSTGKKRGTYKRKASTQSTEAAETFEAYDVETVGGVVYTKVFAGEGVILKEHEHYWRMLTTSFTPPEWGEHFQSSTTIPQEKKRKICSGAELNLN